MVKMLRRQCIELLVDIEARLDFEDEMPELDVNQVTRTIDGMWNDVQLALDAGTYGRLLQSGLQVLDCGSCTSSLIFLIYFMPPHGSICFLKEHESIC